MPGHARQLWLFTDDPAGAAATLAGADVQSRGGGLPFSIARVRARGFPADTLYRYHLFASRAAEIAAFADWVAPAPAPSAARPRARALSGERGQVLYMDIDLRVPAALPPAALAPSPAAPLLAVRHPLQVPPPAAPRDGCHARAGAPPALRPRDALGPGRRLTGSAARCALVGRAAPALRRRAQSPRRACRSPSRGAVTSQAGSSGGSQAPSSPWPATSAAPSTATTRATWCVRARGPRPPLRRRAAAEGAHAICH